jgi:hypothetical protein
VDIESVVIRQGHSLDWNPIFVELEPLAAVHDAPGLVDRVRQLGQDVLKRG